MPTNAHREYFSPGPGNQYGFRDFYRYPEEREPWVGGRSPYSRERERDRERERERDRERQRDRVYRSSNISPHFERDSQHDPYEYRERDYHRKRYPRGDWDYRRAGIPSGPGYRDDSHDPRYETSLPRGESGESERNGRYFMATRHNHWRQRDRRSSSRSTRSSITNSPPPPSHHRRSAKASTRSVSPRTRSSAGNSRGSSPRRPDLERVVSSKRPLKISIQKRADNSENEEEPQHKEQVEESILHCGTESSNVDKNLHNTGVAIHDETDLEERSLGNVHNSADEKSEGFGSNEKGGWTGWRSIEQPGLVATNEEKEREQKKLKDDAADSETVTDTADMDLSSGENDEQPSQPHQLSADELESMEESDAVDDSAEYLAETLKKDNEVVDVPIDNDKINNHIDEESLPSKMNDELDNHPDTQISELTNHENRSLPVIPEVTHISTSSQYIIESSSQLEDDKIDYNAIGAEIEKVENEIDHYKSLLEQKRKRIEEKNIVRASRKSKSNKRVNFDFHQEAILIEVIESNEQTNVNDELTTNHKVNNIQNGETVFSECMSLENDKVTSDYEENASNTKPSNMWEIIYLENKEKTEDVPFDSLVRFGSWGQTNEIYKSLSEYPFYQQNILDYDRLRHMLMEDFQNQKANIKQKELALQQEWKTVHYAWKQKFESLQKTKGKMKQDDNDGNSSTSGFAARWPVRTNRGRRRGDVVRSEAEMEEVMKILQDEQRKCQTWANVPSMILDPKERQQAKFINNNRCVSDPESFYDFNNDVNIDWTTQERDNFYELFKSFPKKFGKIAEHLKDKSANDCVIYYYRNKKELKLKDLIPKNGRGQRTIALNSKARKNNHLSPNNNQIIVPINSSSSGVINNIDNNNEGLATINEISETNEIFERPNVETVPLLIESEPRKHSEENSESVQHHHNENVLSNVQENSKTQEQLVNNSEPSHNSAQETVEESSLPVAKKTRTSKPRRKPKAVKDSDQQEEGEPAKKKRNTLHGPSSIDNDKNNNNNIPAVISDGQSTKISRKQSSANDDDIGVDEAARGLILMSLDGNVHDNNTQSSTPQESTSVSKGKGRPRQIETLDNEISSNRSSIINDDRNTSQKKISSYWNKKEVSLFEQSLNEFGKDFRKISYEIRSKTEVQVKNYYEKHYEKQNIGSNIDEAETRPNTNDDIQSSKEKQSQAKSNVTANQNLAQTSRGNESQRHSAQSQQHTQNDGTRSIFFSTPNTVNATQATERRPQISESSSSLNKPLSSSVAIQPTSSLETAPKSNISLLLNPSNVDVVNNDNWFNESSGEQSEVRSNRGNENEAVVDSETVNDRITGTISNDANMQNAISLSRQIPPHIMTQNSEFRSNNHQSLSQQPSSQYAYAQMQQQMQQIANIQNMQKRHIEQQQRQQQHYAHIMSNPQNQQSSQRFRPSYNIYMHQQANQQVHQQVHQPIHQQVHQQLHQQAHQQSHHQIQQQRISNPVIPVIVPMNNYRLYRPTYLLPSGLTGNNNTVVGQQSVNTGHHNITTTGSSSTSQHNSNVSQQSSFTTLQSHQSTDYNTNEMMVGAPIHRVGSPFNGTSHSSHHLFTQTPQPQVRPHQSQVYLQRVIGHPASSISGTPVINELNYSGHHHLLQNRPSIVMPSSPPNIVQGIQGVAGQVGHGHGHAHNFTDPPRPFSGDQQQQSSSSERSNSPILYPKIEPPS
jgi:hypothetical protein